MSGNLAKSGTHQLALVGETYDHLLSGEFIATVHQRPLVTVSTPIFSVIVQAQASNEGIVYIGSETEGCYFELAAGASLAIPINDLSKVYARAADDVLYLNWLAVR